jgi:hypothetical protein
MTRARLRNPNWIFWACAGFLLPVLNPPLVLFTGGAAVVFAWIAARNCSPDAYECPI